MKRKMMVADIQRADMTLEWRRMMDLPKRNGWYECYRYVIDINTGKPTPVVCVGLFHDGVWRDRIAGAVRWREPIRMEDTTGKPINDYEGMMKLLEAIFEGIGEDFREALTNLVEPFNGSTVIYRYLTESKGIKPITRSGLQVDFYRKRGMTLEQAREASKRVDHIVNRFKTRNPKAVSGMIRRELRRVQGWV